MLILRLGVLYTEANTRMFPVKAAKLNDDSHGGCEEHRNGVRARRLTIRIIIKVSAIVHDAVVHLNICLQR